MARHTENQRNDYVASYDIGSCTKCGKLVYKTRADARKAARRIDGRHGKLRAYQCGDWWHLTSQNTTRVTIYRNKQQP